MGNFITSKLPEKPLCIGFYNHTNGVGYGMVDDLMRLWNIWGLNVSSILCLRQLFLTFAEVLSKINKNLLWTHIAHSEAGLITNAILTTGHDSSESAHFKYFKENLITLSYGAVAPIPDIVLYAINTYSKDDIALRFAKAYLDKFPKPEEPLEDFTLRTHAKEIYDRMPLKTKTIEALYNELKNARAELDKKRFISEYPYTSTKNGCTVTIVKSKVSKSQQPKIQGDHAFDGETYQDALKMNILMLRDQKNYGGIYRGF